VAIRRGIPAGSRFGCGPNSDFVTFPTFEEAHSMTDHSMEQKSPKGLFGGITPLVKTIALIVTVVGAIPTAITAYHAWQYKVPFSQVSHRLGQYEIWERNIDCLIDYKALSTAGGTKVDAGACPTTGDISLKISATDGKATYEWIAYNQLRKPGEPPPSGLLDLLVGAVRADDTASKSQRLAQSAMEVVCQKLVDRTKLVRIVKEEGKCYREKLSPLRGTIDKREEVPCDTQCKVDS
jgi:hypothetical protein